MEVLMGNFYLMLSKQVHKISLSSKRTGIKAGRFPGTALPLFYTVLEVVSASTMKYDVLRSAALLIFIELAKNHTL